MSRSRLGFVVLSFVSLTIVFVSMGIALADAPRAVAPGKLPPDARLNKPKDLNGYFPFTPPTDVEAWKEQSAAMRRRLAIALGVWPEPEKTPLNPLIHGKVERDTFTVERVAIETMPGYFLTGSLYRPVGKSGKRPGVLCPHGHWANGRFFDHGEKEIRNQIVQGAERFEDSGRSPLQARCMQLARMGCVVFFYDMVGYADNTQISFEVAHRYSKRRPNMEGKDAWGLFSPQADARFQSVMGLQTWNSIRALDFITTLPDVDAEKIGVTGASGGGTQTFILCALDPRPKVAFPAVMVSTAMQGGCTCENASCVRTQMGNIDFAAMFAPKPLCMTSANDWTVEMATKGFPEIQATYALLGAKDNVKLVNGNHFGHNYNYVSRAAMYAWFNKHLGLGLEEPIIENDYKRLTIAEMTVWDDAHPKPPSGDEFEKKLMKQWDADATVKLAARVPKTASEAAAWHTDMDRVIETIVARPRPAAGDVKFEKTDEVVRDNHLQITGLVTDASRGSALPTTWLYPKKWNGKVVVWLDDTGKSHLFAEGSLKPAVAKLVDQGTTVVGVDLLNQGEFLPEGKTLETNRQVDGHREFAGYTYGYNPSLLGHRVGDVASLVTLIRNHDRKPSHVSLVSLSPKMAPVAAASSAFVRGQLDSVAIDTHGFRFNDLTDYLDGSFIPGAVKFGDLPAMLAMASPTKLLVFGEKEKPATASNVYTAEGKGEAMKPSNATGEKVVDEVLGWLGG